MKVPAMAKDVSMMTGDVINVPEIEESWTLFSPSGCYLDGSGDQH